VGSNPISSFMTTPVKSKFLIEEIEYKRLKQLEAAVIKMVTLRGDDLCWRDIYTDLAKLVGIDFCPELMIDQDKMLANCKCFTDSLYNGGPYKPVYVELNKTKD
jgi:hypothetical protein